MKPLIELLQKSELFRGTPEDVLEREVLPHGRMQEYSKDQFLIEPKQKLDQIGMVVSGKVQILHLFANGSHSLMSVIAPGGFVGADLICTRSGLSPYHARAAADASIFWLPAALLQAPGLLNEELRVRCLEHMLTLISQENMKKEYRLAILSQSGLRDRILTYLSMQGNRRRRDSFIIPFNREEMAAFLCVNRSALSHELGKMQKEGLISFRKNAFTLHRRSES